MDELKKSEAFELTLSVVEYAAANAVLKLDASAFALLSNARQSKIGTDRIWVLYGDVLAYKTLFNNIVRELNRPQPIKKLSILKKINKTITENVTAKTSITTYG